MELAGLVTYLDTKFDGIDKKFDAIEARFETIDAKFDAIDTRLSAIDRRFDFINKRFRAIDQRFDAIEARFDAIDKRFDGLDKIFVTKDEFAMGLFELEQRLESKFNARFDFLSEQLSNMYSYLDEHSRKMDEYFQKFTMLNSQVNRHERCRHETAHAIGLTLKS